MLELRVTRIECEGGISSREEYSMKRIFNRGSLTRWDTLVELDGSSETMELLAIFKLVKLRRQIGPV